ncbi:hypothetical protein BKA01_008040 [Pseudonocardia eucalypti]|nr:hypothetical protein [Pseudonocardia eucalypti]MBB6380763.1 hypothetical protein [Pseudonocardia eucalypti]
MSPLLTSGEDTRKQLIRAPNTVHAQTTTTGHPHGASRPQLVPSNCVSKCGDKHARDLGRHPPDAALHSPMWHGSQGDMRACRGRRCRPGRQVGDQGGNFPQRPDLRVGRHLPKPLTCQCRWRGRRVARAARVRDEFANF